MSIFTLAISFDHFQFALIHGPSIRDSYAILLCTALIYFYYQSHPQLSVLFYFIFLLWLHPFILSGVISPLISSSILGTYQPGEFIFQYPIFCLFVFCLFILFMRFLRQEYWGGLPFPSPVDHILLEFSTMTRLRWSYTAWLIVSLS